MELKSIRMLPLLICTLAAMLFPGPAARSRAKTPLR